MSGNDLPPKTEGRTGRSRLEQVTRQVPGLRRLVRNPHKDDPLDDRSGTVIDRDIHARSDPEEGGWLDVLDGTEDVHVASDTIDIKGSILDGSQDSSIDARSIQAWTIGRNASSIDIRADDITTTNGLGRGLTNSSIEADRIDVRSQTFDQTQYRSALSGVEDVTLRAGTVTGSTFFNSSNDSLAIVDELYTDEIGEGADSTLIAARDLYHSPDHRTIRDHELPLTTADTRSEIETDAIVVTPQDIDGAIRYEGDWGRLAGELEDLEPAAIGTSHLKTADLLEDSYTDPSDLSEDVRTIHDIDQQLDTGDITDDHDERAYTILAASYDTEETTIRTLLNEETDLAAAVFDHPERIETIGDGDSGPVIETSGRLLRGADGSTIQASRISSPRLLQDAEDITIEVENLEAGKRMLKDASGIDLTADRMTADRIGWRLQESTIRTEYIGGEEADLFERAGDTSIRAATVESGSLLDHAEDISMEADEITADELGYWTEDLNLRADQIDADTIYEQAQDSSIEAHTVEAEDILTSARDTYLQAEELAASSIGADAYNVVIAAETLHGDIDEIGEKATLITAEDIDGAIQYTGDWDELTPALEQGIANRAFRMEELNDRVFEDPDQLLDDMTALSVIEQASFITGTPQDLSGDEALQQEYKDDPDTFTDAATEEYGDSFISSLFVIDDIFEDWQTFYEEQGDELTDDDIDMLDTLYDNVKNADQIGRDTDDAAETARSLFEGYREELQDWDRRNRNGLLRNAIAIEEVLDTDITTYIEQNDEEDILEDLTVVNSVTQSARQSDMDFEEAVERYRQEFEATEDVFRALATADDDEKTEAVENMPYLEDLTGLNWNQIVDRAGGTVDAVMDELELIGTLGTAHDEYDRNIDDALDHIRQAYQDDHEELTRLHDEGYDDILEELPLLGELGVGTETARGWEDETDGSVTDVLWTIYHAGKLAPEYGEDEAAETTVSLIEEHRETLFGLDEDRRDDIAKQLFNVPALLGEDIEDWLEDERYEDDLEVLEALKAATKGSDMGYEQARQTVAQRYAANEQRTRELAGDEPGLIEPMLQLEAVTGREWGELLDQDREELEQQARTIGELYDGKDYDTTDEEIQEMYESSKETLHELASTEEGRYIIRNATKVEETAEIPLEKFIETFEGGAPEDLIMAPEYGTEKLITTDGEVTEDVDEAATRAYQDGLATLERLARNGGRFAFELPAERQEELIDATLPDEVTDEIDPDADEHVLSQIGQQIGEAYQDGDQQLAEELKEAKHTYQERLDEAKRQQAFDDIGIDYGADPDFSDLEPRTVRDALDQFAQEYLDDCKIQQTAEEVSDSIVIDADVGGNAVEIQAWDKDLDTLPYKDRSVPCTFPGGMDSYEHNFMGYMADPGTQVLTIEAGDKSGAALLNHVERDGEDYLFVHSVESDDGITASSDVSRAIDEGIREYAQEVIEDPSEPDIEGLIYSMDGHNSAARDFQDVLREDDGFRTETMDVDKYGRMDIHFDNGFPEDPTVDGYVREHDQL